jgi:NAD(P)-dependent dehydrogenase (short-subunit alcohol dehydrogenase family)
VNSPLLLVLGAGPGLGLSVARRFGREGYAVALVGQTAEAMQPLAETLTGEGITASGLGVELTDPSAVHDFVSSIGEEAGHIDVLHFNPSAWREKDPLELTVAELFEDLSLGVAALLPAIQAARPFMSEGGRVLVTGSAAADKPWHKAASLGVQKAAVRNLVTSLDATLEPDGIRAVAVQINGLLDKEGPFAPPAVAEALYAATVRPNDGWTPHVSYDG